MNLRPASPVSFQSGWNNPNSLLWHVSDAVDLYILQNLECQISVFLNMATKQYCVVVLFLDK